MKNLKKVECWIPAPMHSRLTALKGRFGLKKAELLRMGLEEMLRQWESKTPAPQQ